MSVRACERARPVSLVSAELDFRLLASSLAAGPASRHQRSPRRPVCLTVYMLEADIEKAARDFRERGFCVLPRALSQTEILEVSARATPTTRKCHQAHKLRIKALCLNPQRQVRSECDAVVSAITGQAAGRGRADAASTVGCVDQSSPESLAGMISSAFSTSATSRVQAVLSCPESCVSVPAANAPFPPAAASSSLSAAYARTREPRAYAIQTSTRRAAQEPRRPPRVPYAPSPCLVHRSAAASLRPFGRRPSTRGCPRPSSAAASARSSPPCSIPRTVRRARCSSLRRLGATTGAPCSHISPSLQREAAALPTGHPCFLLNEQYIVKPPYAGQRTEFPWHRDSAWCDDGEVRTQCSVQPEPPRAVWAEAERSPGAAERCARAGESRIARNQPGGAPAGGAASVRKCVDSPRRRVRGERDPLRFAVPPGRRTHRGGGRGGRGGRRPRRVARAEGPGVPAGGVARQRLRRWGAADDAERGRRGGAEQLRAPLQRAKPGRRAQAGVDAPVLQASGSVPVSPSGARPVCHPFPPRRLFPAKRPLRSRRRAQGAACRRGRRSRRARSPPRRTGRRSGRRKLRWRGRTRGDGGGCRVRVLALRLGAAAARRAATIVLAPTGLTTTPSVSAESRRRSGGGIFTRRTAALCDVQVRRSCEGRWVGGDATRG